MAFDGSGNMYVTDNGHNRVVKVPAGGGAATAFASVTPRIGLAVDANGNVFVVDNEDWKIVKITSGGVTSNFETGLTNPVDVAVDGVRKRVSGGWIAFSDREVSGGGRRG